MGSQRAGAMVRGPSDCQGVRRLRSAASSDQDFERRSRWQAGSPFLYSASKFSATLFFISLKRNPNFAKKKNPKSSASARLRAIRIPVAWSHCQDYPVVRPALPGSKAPKFMSLPTPRARSRTLDSLRSTVRHRGVMRDQHVELTAKIVASHRSHRAAVSINSSLRQKIEFESIGRDPCRRGDP
jgi:hypothetical protein